LLHPRKFSALKIIVLFLSNGPAIPPDTAFIFLPLANSLAVFLKSAIPSANLFGVGKITVFEMVLKFSASPILIFVPPMSKRKYIQ